jgi:hypothetical protein
MVSPKLGSTFLLLPVLSNFHLSGPIFPPFLIVLTFGWDGDCLEQVQPGAQKQRNSYTKLEFPVQNDDVLTSGSVSTTVEEKKQLAALSLDWNLKRYVKLDFL